MILHENRGPADPIRVQPHMDRIEREVREGLRRRLIEHGGGAEFSDAELFERVHSILVHAAARRDPDALLLPELLDGGTEWELNTELQLSSHRPRLGPLILLVKRRLLLPLSRWLFDYSRENFRRQQALNRILFACIEELAIENARLRRDLEAAAGRPAAR